MSKKVVNINIRLKDDDRVSQNIELDNVGLDTVFSVYTTALTGRILDDDLFESCIKPEAPEKEKIIKKMRLSIIDTAIEELQKTRDAISEEE